MNMYDYSKYLVDSRDKMPIGQHWAILIFEPYSVHHEGDERSRTNPGHGYGAYTESGTKLKYYAFPTPEEWKACIEHLEADIRDHMPYKRTIYCALVVTGQAKICTNISVEVK